MRCDESIILSKRCNFGLYYNMLIDVATWFTSRRKGERVGLSGKWVVLMDKYE